MEEKKLTDEEIVKALEHCYHNRSCEYCYHNDENGSGEIVCRSRLMEKALDLIHRLQDENKELKSPKFASWKLKFFNLKDELKKELAEHEEFTKKAKAEIERLTERETFLENAWKTSLESTQTVEIALKANRAREKELQKQVDELKESANGYLLTTLYKKQADDHKRAISKQRTYWEKKVEQAVKDTAKEILHLIKSSEYVDSLKTISIWAVEKIFKERYGVEVE